MVHLLHRLYAVGTPENTTANSQNKGVPNCWIS